MGLNRLPTIREELCKAVYKGHSFYNFKSMYDSVQSESLYYGKCPRCGRLTIVSEKEFRQLLKDKYGG